MPLFGVTPALSIVVLPLLALLMLLTALGVSLWLSALDVQYRDVKHVLPFLIQVWMYACPIIYPISLIPERWHLVYGLNPMVGAVEGFRWALTGQGDPPIALIAQSGLIGLLVLVSGAMFFRRTERTFADTI
jgi:lipopolysaccharide transport system permease protein